MDQRGASVQMERQYKMPTLHAFFKVLACVGDERADLAQRLRI